MTDASRESTPQRDFAVSVVRKLRDAGCEAFWAGGCVRDALLGRTPNDYDVATDAPPDRVRELFGKRRTLAVGASFGVITVLGPKGAGQVEVATFRTDVSYADGRRPKAVRFTTAEEDARRRDFTINGLFYDPLDDRVIDYVGGRNDLIGGVVRAIGDADERFAEDRLRMLRAVRFAASLVFVVEPSTADAIQHHAAALSAVSAERIGSELRRMLTEPHSPRALRMLRETNLLRQVLPVLGEAGDAAFEEAVEGLGAVAPASAALALTVALRHVADAETAAGTARGLKWTNKEIGLVKWLLSNRGKLEHADRRPWSAVQPLLAADGGADLVALHAADATDAKTVSFCNDRLIWPRERLDPPPLVSGADLIAAGAEPGPGFGELLAHARTAQLDGEAATRDEALRLLGLAADCGDATRP